MQVSASNEENLFSFFMKKEEELNLFSLYSRDIQIWKLIRVFVYKKILNDDQVDKYTTVKQFPDTIHRNSIPSFFKNKTKCNILVLENPRKIRHGSSFIDPYTDDVVNSLLQNNDPIRIINDGFDNNRYVNRADLEESTSSFYYDYILKAVLKCICSRVFFEELVSFERDVYKSFGVSLSLNKMARNYLANFYLDYFKYSKIFSLSKPKILVLVCSYGKEGIIQAARNNNIYVIERQHGYMGERHLAYSFNPKHNVRHFPDEIHFFGSYWQHTTHLPPCRSLISGLSSFSETLKSTLKSSRNQKTKVIIISQLSVSSRLFHYTIKLAQKNQNETFIYKLHPKEKYLFDLYTNKLIQASISNIELICEGDTFHLISQASHIVAVTSTSIFEALYQKKLVILINFKGLRMVQDLHEKKLLFLFTPSEVPLISELDRSFIQEADSDAFYCNYVHSDKLINV